MTIWFAHRSHYDFPATRYLKRFDEKNIVEWFRSHCPPIPDSDPEAAEAHVREHFGIDAYGIPHFLMDYGESGLPPPETEKHVHRIIQQCWYVEGEIICQPGAIQVLDNDDELEFAFYIFDDAFAHEYPDRVAWLLQEDWRLPSDVGPGGFRATCQSYEVLPSQAHWKGATYFVPLTYYDSLNLTELCIAAQIKKVRLPQLARHLACIPREARTDWPSEWNALADEILQTGKPKDPTERAFLRGLRKNPEDESLWEVFGDWLEERGLPRTDQYLLEGAFERISKAPPGRRRLSGDLKAKRKGNRSQWHVTPHLAQLCLHRATYHDVANFVHWVLFDDIWASAHPDLANSLLRQVDRWDVLSSPRRRRSED